MSEESTTPDLVELGSRHLEAANRRDFDAVLSFYVPDAVLENAEGLGTFEGKAPRLVGDDDAHRRQDLALAGVRRSRRAVTRGGVSE
jgi:ketosteroid isomerase-like protein